MEFSYSILKLFWRPPLPGISLCTLPAHSHSCGAWLLTTMKNTVMWGSHKNYDFVFEATFSFSVLYMYNTKKSVLACGWEIHCAYLVQCCWLFFSTISMLKFNTLLQTRQKWLATRLELSKGLLRSILLLDTIIVWKLPAHILHIIIINIIWQKR